jgi:hypothetical protein
LITLAGDPFSVRLANHLSQYFMQHFPELKFNVLVDFDCPRTVNNNIDSVPPSAICIEVGPLAHGTLNNPSLVKGTRASVEQCLSFIHAFNISQERHLSESEHLQKIGLDGFTLWKPMYYPKPNKDGFTVQACLHPNLIGKDFEELRKGDPLFIDLDTFEVVETYNEEEPAYPCFIGEAAYFSSGIAMWLCKKTTIMSYE